MEETKKKEDLHAIYFRPPIEANAIGHIMAEIFKDGVYYPFLHGKNNLTVIDAGANIGIWSYFASRYASKIYAIEPTKEHMDVLLKNLEVNNITNIVQPCKFALSMLDKEEEWMYHYTNRTMHSLYGNIQGTGGLAQTGKETVQLKRLDTFFKEEKIEKVDFLKLDVEGVEFEILGSDSFANVADKISELVVEVHQYSGRHPNQIVESLEQNGFVVQQIPNDAMILYAKHK